jgi:hypothetical protein
LVAGFQVFEFACGGPFEDQQQEERDRDQHRLAQLRRQEIRKR